MRSPRYARSSLPTDSAALYLRPYPEPYSALPVDEPFIELLAAKEDPTLCEVMSGDLPGRHDIPERFGRPLEVKRSLFGVHPLVGAQVPKLAGRPRQALGRFRQRRRHVGESGRLVPPERFPGLCKCSCHLDWRSFVGGLGNVLRFGVVPHPRHEIMLPNKSVDI
jgi:hypothetical protein